MNTSESITNNFLIEVDRLYYRHRNIKENFQTTSNYSLQKRLIQEKDVIIERLNQIYKVSKFLYDKSHDKISFTALLYEKSKRLFNETRKESKLFFL